MALEWGLTGKFACNFDHAKAKYYRSSNAILGKLGKQRNPAVALQLISTIAVPVLTYACETFNFNKSQRDSMDHPWNRTFMKIYNTFDKCLVQQCQYYGGFLPTSLTIDLKRCNFLKKLSCTENSLLFFIYSTIGYLEWNDIAAKYNSDVNNFYYNFHYIIHKAFYEKVV